MQPNLITAPELLPVLSELMALEPIFHHPEAGTTRADFERLIVPGFWETGASGRRYSSEFVLDVLENRSKSPAKESWTTSEPYCQEIAPDNFLLTYTLTLDGRTTRRMTIWRRYPDGWKIVYHQGTVAE